MLNHLVVIVTFYTSGSSLDKDAKYFTGTIKFVVNVRVTINTRYRNHTLCMI